MSSIINWIIEFNNSLSLLSAIMLYSSLALIVVGSIGFIINDCGFLSRRKYRRCEKCHAKMKNLGLTEDMFGAYELLRCPKCGHEEMDYKIW